MIWYDKNDSNLLLYRGNFLKKDVTKTLDPKKMNYFYNLNIFKRYLISNIFVKIIFKNTLSLFNFK